MPKPSAPTFSVVLRPNLPPEERAFLSRFCCTVKGEEPEPALLHFLCTRIDLSHPYYIELEAFRPEDERSWPIRIPHHLVLLISGAENDAPIGFLTSAP